MRRFTACLMLVTSQLTDLATTRMAVLSGATEINPLPHLSWSTAVCIKVTAATAVAVTLLLLPERFRPVRWAVILSLLGFGVSVWNLSQAMTG